MPNSNENMAANPTENGSMVMGNNQTITIVFKFAEVSKLMTGQRITGFPSYVVGASPILIDPIPVGGDKAAMQAAINRRAADLATVAQALGLASSQLADAISAFNKGG